MIWEFTDLLGRRLVAWGALSIILGAAMIAMGDAAWRGAGAMLVAWGAVDAAIGLAARRRSERNRRRTIGDQAARDRDARRIRAILLANAALDVASIAFGAWLVVTASGDAFRTGAGWGVVVQGGFLLLFDLLHARWVPPAGPLLPDGVELFAGPGHEPFRLVRADAPESVAGSPVRGALLVHGFAGSPRELRGLAAVLAASGWIVEVPILPGHGRAFRDIAEYRVEDWLAAVDDAAGALRASGVTELLVAGHSVGGSLALATAERLHPDSIVLLAPFAWPTPAWQRLAGPLLRVILPPGFRVFSRMELDDPAVRSGLGALLPGMDVDDPATAVALRELRVPVSLLEQLFRVSRLARAAAPGIGVPVLAVQGREDTVSRPGQTRALLDRLPSPPILLEVDAGHDLVTEASPARDEVLSAVLAFASRGPAGAGVRARA